MSCGFKEQLTALRDGALPETEAWKVEAHAADCADCQKALSALDRTLAALRAVPPMPVGPANTARLLSRLARQQGAVPSAFSLRPWWLPAGGLALAASAAAVVAVVSGPGGDRTWRSLEAEPDGATIAANYDLLSDYELVGLEQAGDVELVAQLDELEKGDPR